LRPTACFGHPAASKPPLRNLPPKDSLSPFEDFQDYFATKPDLDDEAPAPGTAGHHSARIGLAVLIARRAAEEEVPMMSIEIPLPEGLSSLPELGAPSAARVATRRNPLTAAPPTDW